MAKAPYNCFAVAAPGLEPLVAAELTSLGERPRIEDGGVSWSGDASSLMRANLWLRTASRVLVRFASFRATAFYELEKRAKKLPWADFVSPRRAVDFRVTAHKSRLYHSDAIAERLRGAVPTTAEAAADGGNAQLFVVRVERDEFAISVDASGDLLHMRGYRQEVGKAPLRETLAAALLLGAGWQGDTPLIDPFCGSGTIPIEGALLARRIAPGIARRFAFMEWPAHDAGAWSGLVADARSRELPTTPVPIQGSDRDAGAIAAAGSNAARAGVSGDIELSKRAISALAPTGRDTPPGLIATNPPYGVRVGERKAMRDLYARFGQVVRRFDGWKVALYSPADELARQTGFDFDTLFRTSNGGIRISALVASASGQFLH